MTYFDFLLFDPTVLFGLRGVQACALMKPITTNYIDPLTKTKLNFKEQHVHIYVQLPINCPEDPWD